MHSLYRQRPGCSQHLALLTWVLLEHPSVAPSFAVFPPSGKVVCRREESGFPVGTLTAPWAVLQWVLPRASFILVSLSKAQPEGSAASGETPLQKSMFVPPNIDPGTATGRP